MQRICKIFLAIICLLCAYNPIQAQTSVAPGPGYIVTMDDDTLHGQVTTIYADEYGGTYVRMISGGDNRERPYSIKKVKLLVWSGAKYLPQMYTYGKPAKNRLVFMRVLMENASSCVLEYETQNEDGFVYNYYLNSENTQVAELTKNTFKAYIAQYFSTCQALIDSFASNSSNKMDYKVMHEIALLFSQRCK
jgi:hypothetical protein